MPVDPIDVLEDILKRNGFEVDLRENEADRYFFFDSIADPQDLDLAWRQFPAHEEIRARAADVDAAAEIVAGWGYRVPKQSNRCSDSALANLVRGHITTMRPLIGDDDDDIRVFIDRGYEIQIVGTSVGPPPDPMDNSLFLVLYEAACEFKREHFPFDTHVMEVIYDWAIYLTKCDEVVLYLLWPVFQDTGEVDPHTPEPGFQLWQLNCRTNYWIPNDDAQSRLVYVQPPWAS